MYIKIHVTTEARKEACNSISKDHFEISVREKALRNMANERVIALLRAHFGPNAGAIRLVSGHHSPHKIISVDFKE